MNDAHVSLGGLIRTWRDRLDPGEVGLSATGRRRATGLRREEFAALAGVSVDYVVRLEQGRARHPSRQVVAALARALHLDDGERDLLFEAAGLQPPRAALFSDHVPPGVRRMTARLEDQPIAVFAADWTLISWSTVWTALFGDAATWPAEHRNLLRLAFLDGGSYPLPTGDEGSLGAALVADLHAAVSRYPQDRRLSRLVAELTAGSDRFRALWQEGRVAYHASAVKTIRHPVVGELTLDCDVLTAPGADLRIVVYSAALHSDAAAKLDFLRVGAVRQLPSSAIG